MSSQKQNLYSGPALFSYGFRPFFLGATLFATGFILVWMLIYDGQIVLSAPFPAVEWHIHEMLFGYTSAVISGFLFTAIPNWTGRMPIRGWPLIALGGLWLAGRIAMTGVTGLNGWVVMAIDTGFLAAIATMISIEIIAGRNWRNLKIVAPVTIYLFANILFHVEVLTQGSSDYSRRLGFAVVVFLITLIGGRIIPSFTRNWLVKNNPGKLPIPFNRFDGIVLAASIVALIFWVIMPESMATKALLGAAAPLHVARLLRWQGARTLRSPLLLMLHLAYAFIPAGLLTLAIGDTAAGEHLLGIGAIAGMTMAVMMRATLGHTGRALVAGVTLTLAFSALILAALVRSFLAADGLFGLSGLWIAAILWTFAYGGFVLRIGPALLGAKPAQRTANPRSV